MGYSFLYSEGVTGQSAPGHASSGVPELPNFITLLNRKFEGIPWIQFLHQWENVIFSLIVAFGISTLFYFGSKHKELVPSGLQNFLELIVDELRKLILGIIGPQGEKYVPFLGSLFIYILCLNLIGLVPLMKSPSSSLNITAALAICVFVLVQYLNIKNMGLGGYLYHLAGSPKDLIGWLMVPLMLPIEIITQFSRPLTLAFRLFGNIFGEETIIAAFSIFGVALLSSFGPQVGFPLQIPFMFLVLLTGTMQALVFTLLSAVYILLSIPEEHSSH